MNEIIIMLLVPFSFFGGFNLSDSNDKNTENISKKEYNLKESYSQSVIYLDIEQAFKTEVYEQKENSGESISSSFRTTKW